MPRFDVRSCLDPLTARAIDAAEAGALLLDARHLVETTTADDRALEDAAVLLHEFSMLDECIQLSPGFAWAYHSKARILAMLGRRAEALAFVDLALSRGRFGAAEQLRAWLLAQPETPRRTQVLEARCATCSAAVVGGRCPCEGRETIALTPNEVRMFRKKPCSACGYESLGFAERCAACHQPI